MRTGFYAVMTELQAELATASEDIAVREAVLKSAMSDMKATLQGGIGASVLRAEHPLARHMIGFNAELAQLLQGWLDRVAKHDRTMAFRSGFTDSLVVFVLGKVKAGKSSLGNYMVYGNSNPDAAARASSRARFFTAATAGDQQDQANSAQPVDWFRVGVRETTSATQGFHLPGLTWIDSPGLHSTTWENGLLAADYADVADLVIYPMHTGNPGRTGDVAEIRGLLRARKRVLVVITQCDRPEEDEEPDGTIVQRWVMKDSAARQGQIDYVRHAVAEGGASIPLDVVSLSVRHAETHGNDPAALERSGVADFFRALTKIAHSEGVRHKQEAPSRNLNHFVGLLLGDDTGPEAFSVQAIRNGLVRLDRRLADVTKELDRGAERATAAVLRRIGPMVAEKIARYADNQDQDGFEQACTTALRHIVAEETGTTVLPLLAQTGAILPANDFARTAAFASMKIETVRIPRSNRGVRGAVGSAGGGAAGAWVGAEGGALLGTAILPGIGTTVGFMVGGALGALLGGIGGNAAGRATGSDWHETMQSGDNRAEVEASATEALQKAGSAGVAAFFENLHAATVAPVARDADRLTAKLDEFSHILATKVRSHG
ncbi:hypothetical protein ACFFIC_21880 [Roseomonas vinacea]|uniref:G domain-containing protein n=1 Tax=Muricoccus vinaceus TaxID=424704 RepID=A0ABV6IX28_9PROT